MQKVKRLASDRYGRQIKVAMSAFAIVREHTAQAEARLEAIYRSADQQQIKYFQEQIDPRDFQGINYSTKIKSQNLNNNDNHYEGGRGGCRRQPPLPPSSIHEKLCTL